jgi:hypothetical protein
MKRHSLNMEAIVFIHPKDFGRVLKNDGNALDVIIETWYDGLETSTINGVRYRQTNLVPQVLHDFDVEGHITNVDANGDIVQDLGSTSDNSQSSS